MEELLLGELGANAATATQVAPGVFSFKPSAPTEEEKAAQAAAEARGERWAKPAGFDTSMIPDLSLVHRAMIPGIWNRVRMGTFPENWLVLGFDPDSQAAIGATRGSTTQAVLESYGQGGLQNVVRHLRSDAVQFCGFRVSVARTDEPPPEPEPPLQPPSEGEASATRGGLDPATLEDEWLIPGGAGIVGKYVFLAWVGEEASEATRRQASAQLLFFRDYFHHADVELVVAPPPGVPLDGKELHALIAAQLVEGLRRTKGGGSASAADDLEIDFTNRDAPSVCTHYDWEIAEGDEQIADLDALSHALQELEEAYAEVEDEDREAADAMLETTKANLGLRKGFLDGAVNKARADTTTRDTVAGSSGAPLPPTVEVDEEQEEEGEEQEEEREGADREFFHPDSPSKQYNQSAFWRAPMPFADEDDELLTEGGGSAGYRPVGWEEIQPPRPYRSDASATSAAASRQAQPERRPEAGGSVWIADCSEQWRYIDGVAEQIEAMAADPARLSALVRVGEITDPTHPAAAGAEEGSGPAYLAYAALPLAAHSVLGFYGGRTQTLEECEARGGSEPHYSLRLECTAGWGAEGALEVEGGPQHGGNELSMVNDYRDDLQQYASKAAQKRRPNASVVEVWLAGEPLPRACFVTTVAVGAGEELLIDYSDGFWATALALRKQEQEEAAAAAKAVPAVKAGLRRGFLDKEGGEERRLAAERAAAAACGGDEAGRQWAREQRAHLTAAIGTPSASFANLPMRLGHFWLQGLA